VAALVWFDSLDFRPEFQSRMDTDKHGLEPPTHKEIKVGIAYCSHGGFHAVHRKINNLFFLKPCDQAGLGATSRDQARLTASRSPYETGATVKNIGGWGGV
jgi:hypothetical protein